MKHLIPTLVFTTIFLSCQNNAVEPIPDPTLEIKLGRNVNYENFSTIEYFLNQDTIQSLEFDSTLIVGIMEDYLLNPELLGGMAKVGTDFSYTLLIETIGGDKEVFVTGKNLVLAGGGGGESQLNEIWYASVENDFIVQLDKSDVVEKGNSILELKQSHDDIISISYISPFSDLKITKHLRVIAL